MPFSLSSLAKNMSKMFDGNITSPTLLSGRSDRKYLNAFMHCAVSSTIFECFVKLSTNKKNSTYKPTASNFLKNILESVWHFSQFGEVLRRRSCNLVSRRDLD